MLNIFVYSSSISLCALYCLQEWCPKKQFRNQEGVPWFAKQWSSSKWIGQRIHWNIKKPRYVLGYVIHWWILEYMYYTDGSWGMYYTDGSSRFMLGVALRRFTFSVDRGFWFAYYFHLRLFSSHFSPIYYVRYGPRDLVFHLALMRDGGRVWNCVENKQRSISHNIFIPVQSYLRLNY